MHFRTLFLFGALLTLYLAIGGYPSHAQPQVHGSDSVIEKADIILGEGEQRLLRVPGLLKYSIGSPRIRAIPLERNFAKLSQRQDTLLIKGVTAGLSDLWIWKQGGQSEHRTIRVEKNTQTRTLSWDRALAGLQEVEVLYSGKGAILRGRISSLAEAARVSAMVRNYPNVLFNETTLAPELLTQTKAQLEHWLMATPAGKNLRIEQLGEELWVRGSVDSPSVKQALEKQVHALFPTAQTEIDTFPDHSPTIYFRVFLLELKKIKFHSLGLSWPAQTGSIFKVATACQVLTNNFRHACGQLVFIFKAHHCNGIK